MIFTCSYNNYQSDEFRPVSISGDRGRSVKFEGEAYPSLAPKKKFWDIWHSNIGKVSEEENLKYYITEYYKQVLYLLDPQSVYNDLDGSILLCFEEPNIFCHRDIVAAWFNLFLGVEVEEVKVVGFQLQRQERFDVTEILEEVIKKNTNMNGFECIRAYYMYKSGVIEDNQNKINDAFMIEDEYKYLKNKKVKKKSTNY